MESNIEKNAEQNYYKLLGVTSQATFQEIRKAFRKQATKWHPDKNQSSEAKQMFINIKYAYEVLANDQSRRQYDNLGTLEEENFDIAGTLDSFGKRSSDEYKNFIQQKVKFFQNNKFINNCDIQVNINLILRHSWQPSKKNKDHYKNINQSKNNIIEQIKKLIYSQSLIEQEWAQIFAEINFKNLNQLTNLYKELVPDKKLIDNYEKLYCFKIKLLQALILKAQQLPLKFLEKLEEAAFLLPNDQASKVIITIISYQNLRKQFIQALKLQNLIIDFKIPQNLAYGQCLKMNKILMLIRRYDKQISQMSILEGAFTYIDLCRAFASPVLLFGCLTMSCIKFIQYVRKAQDKEKYAYCKLVNNLAIQILMISMKYFTPSMYLYGLKIALSIFVNSNRELNMVKTDYYYQDVEYSNKITLIDENEIKFIQNTTQSLCKMYSVCPFSAHKIYLLLDLVYVDVILRRIATGFLQKMEKANDFLVPNYIASYYLFEGTWVGWYDGDFLQRRFDCINKFLQEKNWQIKECQQILKWPFIKRQDGWISQLTALYIQGQKFTSFDGFTIDFQTGGIELLMSQTQDQNEPQNIKGLFNNADIQDIFSAGVSASFFTLESPNDFLLNHPMQEFRYAPESISRTNYLGTLLHADYLLKMLTASVQINAEKPFKFRNISEGLTKRLPNELKQKITLPKSNILGQAHRFWIEAGQVPFHRFMEEQQQKLTYLYGQVDMKVKTHLLKRNVNGQLVDDIDNQDNKQKQQTPEEVFVKNFTENYCQIGTYYPVFLRLKQLVKISAAYNSLKNIYLSLKQKYQNRQNCQKQIHQYLSKLRSRITFPINTQSLRNNLFNQTLRNNGVLQYQVSPQQIIRVKNQISNQLAKQQIQLIKSIKELIFQRYKGEVNQNDIRAWLSHGSNSFQENLITIQYNNKLNMLSALVSSLKLLKINIDQIQIQNQKIQEKNDSCVWVPAAFNDNLQGRRVYGGVNLSLGYRQVKQICWQAAKDLAIPLLAGLCTGGTGTLALCGASLCRTLGRTVGRYVISKCLKRSGQYLYNKSVNSDNSSMNKNQKPPQPPKSTKQVKSFVVQRQIKNGKQWFYRYQIKNGQKIKI